MVMAGCLMQQPASGCYARQFDCWWAVLFMAGEYNGYMIVVEKWLVGWPMVENGMMLSTIMVDDGQWLVLNHLVGIELN